MCTAKRDVLQYQNRGRRDACPKIMELFMNRLKVEEFFQEFPFLANHVRKEDIREVSVSRVDSQLLKRERNHDYTAVDIISGPCGEVFEDLFLLDDTGKELAKVGKLPEHKHRFWRCKCVPTTTIEEAIVCLGEEAGNVGFVLSVLKEKLVLHKPPKGFTIQGLAKEQINTETVQKK